jgi:hypothetical protein
LSFSSHLPPSPSLSAFFLSWSEPFCSAHSFLPCYPASTHIDPEAMEPSDHGLKPPNREKINPFILKLFSQVFYHSDEKWLTQTFCGLFHLYFYYIAIW